MVVRRLYSSNTVKGNQDTDKKNKHTIHYHDNKAKNSLTDVIGSMGMLSVEVYGL